VAKEGILDTSKIYQDSEGNNCTIWQMIQREPAWSVNRLQEGEKAIERAGKLSGVMENDILSAIDVCIDLGMDVKSVREVVRATIVKALRA
jgi:hypothetical protein